LYYLPYASHFFNGYGGALDTTASISVLAVLSLPVINVKGHLTNGFSQLRKMIYDKKADKKSNPVQE